MKLLDSARFLAAFRPSLDPRRPAVLGTAHRRQLVLVWRGRGRRVTKTSVS